MSTEATLRDAARIAEETYISHICADNAELRVAIRTRTLIANRLRDEAERNAKVTDPSD